MRFRRDAETAHCYREGNGSYRGAIGLLISTATGSHAIYVREKDQARVVIPMHAGELKRKTLRAIIQDLKISVEEFRQML